MEPSQAEREAFRILQLEFEESRWLAHFDRARQLYINIDVSKELRAGSGAMVYHVRQSYEHNPLTKPPPSTQVEPIAFHSRLLSQAEKKYWITELELTCLVWIPQKIRHQLEAAERPPILYTDHSSTVDIAKACSLRSTAIHRQNHRLVRALQHVQQFRLYVYHTRERVYVNRTWPGHSASRSCCVLQTSSDQPRHKLKMVRNVLE